MTDVQILPASRATPLTPERRRQLGRRAQLLAGASVAYNLVEGVVAISAGAATASMALVGFGLDSVIEVLSGLVILWQFGHVLPEAHERRALRIIAVSFFGLAAYVGYEAVEALWARQAPEASTVGVVIAALSCLVMPFLSWAQRRTGRKLASGSVVADSRQTLLCTYLSAALLVGLLVTMWWGWWWADSVIALLIVGVAVREGVQAWRGEACGCGPAAPGAEAVACCAADSECCTGRAA